MLKLGGAGAISCADRPLVRQHSRLVSPNIDHRLDGENHAGPQFQTSMCMAKVWYLWVFMQRMTDAVTNILAHHGKALCLGIRLYSCADVTEVVVWACVFHT